MTVTNGTATAKGAKSAVLYSTGSITATNLTGISEQGEIADVEGDNHIVMNNCTMTSGSSERGIMMLQSGSQDASGYNPYVTATNCSLTTTGSSTPLCEVPTNVTATLNLTDCTLSVASGILMYADDNGQWQTSGSTGILNLQTTQNSFVYSGNAYADTKSNIQVVVGNNVTWDGAINMNDTAKSAKVTIEEGGIWAMTANANVDTLVNNGTIYTNGYTLIATNKSGSGTQETTSINSIKTLNKEANSCIYTLDGKAVGKDANSLPNGIYVIKGRKFLKK